MQYHEVTLALELQGGLKVGMLIRHGAIIGCLICDQTGACSPQNASAHGLCVLGSQLRHEVTVLVPFMLPAGKIPRASVLATSNGIWVRLLRSQGPHQNPSSGPM